MDHPALTAQMLMNLNVSESCKNTPAVGRKLDPHHRALLESGSQSAANSPLPQRRLDKLQGVICDKNTPLAIRRRLEDDSCVEPSPIVSRKFNQIQNNTMSPFSSSNRKLISGRRNTDCSCIERFTDNGGAGGMLPDPSPMMRRRVDSDCSCAKKYVCPNSSVLNVRNHDRYGSPAKSVLGEPGVFSSPLHGKMSGSNKSMTGSFGSPVKNVLGEPGIFASPAHSVNYNQKLARESENDDSLVLKDQTVVSGWFKFRDNKKVSDKYFFF